MMPAPPSFMSELQVVSYGEIWKTLSDFMYWSAKLDRIITVPSGFVTDFASVPRLPVAYLVTGGHARKAAVIHDYFYQTHLVEREEADATFLEAMEVEGVPFMVRQLMWSMVRVFGRGPWERAPNRQRFLNQGLVSSGVMRMVG